EDAGRFLGLTARSLEHLRARGTGPTFYLFGGRRGKKPGKGCIRYSLAALREWAEGKAVRT
ncbi:MAG: hypothetical protein L0323_03385, partial [Planctomycetes bacterium]|nr:hypothetical protein [Planctomycetota bacterium]